MNIKTRLIASTFLASFMLPSAGLAQATSAQSDALPPSPVSSQAAVADKAVEPSEISADGERARDGEIVITGSRIRRTSADSAEPTVRIDAEYLEGRGLTNIADALNEIPGFRGSVTPAGAQASYGQGVNFINTFGLGSNRTLTLLNGRRVVSSNVPTIFGNAAPGTQVDLNIIPTVLVDHIDRVSIGGAPVYGSDAIAGTVNIVLKRRFKGLDVVATNAITEYGDNHRFNVSAAYGMDFAGGRGNLTIAGMYEKVDGVLTNARPFLANGVGGQLNPTSALAATLGPLGRSPLNDGRINPNIGFNDSATDGFPGVVLVNRAGIPSLSINGVIANIGALRPLDFNAQFDSSGNLVPYNRGTLFAGTITSAASRSSGGDGFVFNDFTQITSDLQRVSGNAFLTFDVTDKIRLFGEGIYFQGRGDELIQQQSFNSTLFGGVSGALTFDVNNPFLTTQARNLLVANGYQTFRLSRINLDLGDATGRSKSDLYRGVVGLDGTFNAIGREFNFEVYGNYGRNDFSDFSQQINQQNFVNAINLCRVNPTTNATPGFTPIADAACQPLNVFGQGVATPAAAQYVIQDTITRSRLEQWVVNANVGGSPFDLFRNPVGFNVGYEHRNEKASFTPDAFQQAGLGRSVAVAPNSGEYNLDEVFGEVDVPIITPSNNFIISSLRGFARGRYVDNTVNGGFFAWAAGGSFAPIPDVEFRGNYTKSFRAPAITELFSPVSNTFVTVADLCNPANIAAGPVPATRTRNCNAFLAAFPNGTPLAAATATVPGRSGGNANLQNEEANSFTYGVVVRPRFVPGLTISADYLNIKIKQPIANLTVANIVSACFDNENFNTSDPANGNQFCSQIRRDANGQVPADPLNPAVNSGYVNGFRSNFSGIQGTIDYVTRLNGIGVPGSIQVGSDLFFVRRRLVDTTGVAPARSDGVLGDPQFQAQGRFRYTNDFFTFVTNVNYVGEQLTSRFNRGPSPNDTREFDKYDDYATVDSSISFNVEKRFTLTAVVTNLFNRVGQEYYGIIIPASINDSLGRRFALSARVSY